MRLAHRVGLGLAVAWAAGLLVASYQVQAWQDRLVRVLVHLQANDLVRAKALAAGQGVRSDWYRDRALTLLQAVEQLHEPPPWTAVMPGSWRIFDDLEGRATQRIGHAFSHIVVETLRREIEKRAAHLTGAALDPYTEALDPGPSCKGPSLTASTAPTLDVAQMAEFEAMAHFLAEARRMDQAVASFRAVLHHPQVDGADLQRVVHYSLGTALSGPASRHLALLRQQPDEADPHGEALARRVAHALRCGARAGMAALQARLTTHNPLLASEQAVLEATSPEVLYARGQEHDVQALARRLRDAMAHIEAQKVLLASADHDWMQAHAQGLGPAHDSLLAQLGDLSLLGPALANELAMQARQRRAQWHAAMERVTRGPDAGLAWDDAQARFVQTPRRVELHAGLAALLTRLTTGPTPERLLAQGVSCPGGCARRATTPHARWDTAAEAEAPASTAD